MIKPDKVLRKRPLNEVETAVKKLKKVVLFHPDPIVQELRPKMCICGKPERLRGDKTKLMIQCDACWEWFHFDCVGLDDDYEAEDEPWQCEWCRNGADEKGKQRWTSGRKKAKLRDVKDLPKLNGAQLGENPPPRYSAPALWEDKVAEVRDLSQRSAVKKRKLRVVAQQIIETGGHHLTDAEGAHGTEPRPPDDGLIDEMVEARMIDPDMEDDD